MPPWLWPWISIGFTAPAAIINRGISDDLDHAGFRINLHLTNRTDVGKGWNVHDLIGYPDQRPAQIVRSPFAKRGGRDIEQIHGAVCPLHDEALPLEFDVG